MWAKLPKPGATLETAVWLTGTETPQHIERWAGDLFGMMTSAWPYHKMTLSPFRHTIKYPGDDRVPPVPDYIYGPDVRLLVAEADVVTVERVDETNSFVGQLDKKDLARLRDLTRQAYRGPGRLADWQCDHIIEALGPETAARTLKGAVDTRTIN